MSIGDHWDFSLPYIRPTKTKDKYVQLRSLMRQLTEETKKEQQNWATRTATENSLSYIKNLCSWENTKNDRKQFKQLSSSNIHRTFLKTIIFNIIRDIR